MDCNKDEAIKAREFAENKLTENDIPGAKKFASKAQSLFPGLEGLSQFLAVLDIYAASEEKVNGEVDWYKILDVDPVADDETVRKQYRKLALALHPDKNKAVGADGAFKILSEAWSLLSDKVKRAAYNEKRNIRASYEKVRAENPTVAVEKKGDHDFTNESSSARKASTPANPQPDSVPRTPNSNTFWTSCGVCRIQYQYLAIHRNQNLLCPNCSQPLLARDMPPPLVKTHPPSTPLSWYQQQQGGHPANSTSSNSERKFPPTPNMGAPGFSGVGSINRGNVSQGSSFKFRDSSSMSTPAKAAAQSAYSFQPMGDNLKRAREEAVSGTVNEEALWNKSNASKTDSGLPSSNVSSHGKGEKPAKKRRIDEHKASVGGKDIANQMPPGGGASRRRNISVNQMGRLGNEGVNISGSNKPRGLGELSLSETRNMLMGKAKMEIRKKLHEWKMAAESKPSPKAGKGMEEKPTSVNAPQQSVVRGMKKARNVDAIIKDANISVQPKKSSLSSVKSCSDTMATGIMSESVPEPDGPKGHPSSASPTGSDTKVAEIKTMIVPDPEFYEFDNDRIEEVFAENQVWAAYDDEDGMPRYYAIIHDVISKKPFKVRFSWLRSKSNNEFGLLNWVGCGFTKTCGDFRIGKHEVNKALNSFSHRVKWTKGARGVIQIFPEKGDAWALYRNWSSDWNEFTPDEVIHQYDMVEVLQDYNEEQGVAVAPLVKIAGFRSVFHQHSDTKKAYTIPREEMFRFSHQVPSYLLNGEEAKAVPKGCRELDTAAMPLELLQVIKEADGVGGKTAEEFSAIGDVDATKISGDIKHVLTEEILTYSRKAKGKKVVEDG